MTKQRRMALVLTAGLLFLGMAGPATAASPGTCPDTGSTDCPALPSPSEFTQLADDTLVYFPEGPVRLHLVNMVQLAHEALYPPNPARPVSPIGAVAVLGAYQHQVAALASTARGATDAGTTLLLNEAVDLQRDIVAALPSVRFPRPFHPPHPV